MNPRVSIVLVTRNRKADLRNALESCLAQDHRPLEVLVFDDASTDGTEAVVRAEFPEVRFFREETNRGIAALRNRGFREATGEFVFSIDDDAYYTDASTVSAVVRHFQNEPTAAAIAMPFVEPLRGASVTSGPTCGTELRSYISCAYAIRRRLALDLDGYREFFFYRGEERDLCIRLLDHGFRILYGDSPPVVHLYSPKRAWSQMFPLGIRNNLLFDSLNVPHPYMLPRLAIDAAQLFLYKLTPYQVPSRIAYILRGFGACVKYAALRRPVSDATYRLYRRLPGHGASAAPAPTPAPLRRAAARPPNGDAAS